MSRARRIMVIVFIGVGALALLVVMRASRPSRTIPVAAIDELGVQLVTEGFEVEKHFKWSSEIDLGRANGLKRSLIAMVYPEYQSRGASRIYLKEGAKIGLDFGMRGNEAINLAIIVDPAHAARARKIARDLSALNPDLPMWIQTNAPGR